MRQCVPALLPLKLSSPPPSDVRRGHTLRNSVNTWRIDAARKSVLRVSSEAERVAALDNDGWVRPLPYCRGRAGGRTRLAGLPNVRKARREADATTHGTEMK